MLVILALGLTAGAAIAYRRVNLADYAASIRLGIRSVSIVQLLLGALTIYIGIFLRAVRWALLMPRNQRPPWRVLIPSQFAGFAAIALFGRVADLTRPYLVARRTGTHITEQIAVYSVERSLDLAATAILFSALLLFVPRTAPHHAELLRAGIIAASATAVLLGFALLLRARGDRLANYLGRRLSGSRPRLASEASERLRDLQAGLASLRSTRQMALSLLWSLLIWFGIALSYLFSAHSMRATPQLEHLGLPAILLLMAASMGASLLQLPIVGWFTQIAALSAAYHEFFGAPPAAASLCGLLTFAANTLCVIPAGVAVARFSGLSLREAHHAARKEHSRA